MTPTQLGYMVKGMIEASAAPETIGTQVIEAMRTMLGAGAAHRAIPPQLHPVALGKFCLHNVNMAESCPGCEQRVATSMRIWALALPKGTRVVYIRLGAQEDQQDGGRVRDTDGDAGAEQGYGGPAQGQPTEPEGT